ncbi:MAG TPA: metalloregulator ArsR/SmtB family transcription factor [Ruminiclostridium sp.]
MGKTLNDIENCKCTVIHNDIVEKVKAKLLTEEKSYDLSEFFKVFGDNTRIKIMQALSLEEMCGCDISVLLNMSQSAISHQLQVLRQSKLVKFRKDGKVVYYSLNDAHIKQIFDQGLQHINEK